MIKLNKKIDTFIYLVGTTTICLFVYALIIVFFERFGLIQMYVGHRIIGLSTLDTWLILMLIVWFPLFFSIIFVLYKLKLIKFKRD